LSGAEGI